MCTLSAASVRGVVLITMNRDERRDRPAGLPPALRDDAPVLAPADPAAGGTWIGVRADGAWAALLNGYRADASGIIAPQSRGRLVPMILAARDAEAFWAGVDLSRTSAFRLFVGQGGTARETVWDGSSLRHRDGAPVASLFATSSSIRQAEVTAHRAARHAAWRAGGEALDAYGVPALHLDREGGAWRAVLMEGSVSCTVSMTQVVLAQDEAPRIRYWDRPALGGVPSSSAAPWPNLKAGRA